MAKSKSTTPDGRRRAKLKVRVAAITRRKHVTYDQYIQGVQELSRIFAEALEIQGVDHV
jgi:hypothetical protein